MYPEAGILDTWLLGFRNSQVEKLYCEQYAHNTHTVIDARFVWLHAMSATGYWLLLVTGLAPGSSWSASLWVLGYALAAVLHLMAVLMLKRAHVPVWHSPVAAGLRFVSAVTCLCCLPHWVPPEVTATRGEVLKQLVLGSGCLVGLWHGQGLPLLFRHHLLLFTGSLVVFRKGLNQQVCRVILSTPQAHANMRVLHEWLDYPVRLLLQLYMPLQFPAKLPTGCVCGPSLLFLQLVFGCILPAIPLYLQERRARLKFLGTLTQGRVDVNGDAYHMVPPCDRIALIVSRWHIHGLTACVLLAVLWEMCHAISPPSPGMLEPNMC